jgi:hypothetical protein
MAPIFAHRYIPTLFHDTGCSTPAAYKASLSDPDTMTYEQAMSDTEHIADWKKAMQIEISALESLGSWEEVDVSNAKSRIIPGTWVFKVKRTPDGDIKKRKARFCCRGDMQEDDFETFAPVVSWTSVRFFLVLNMVIGWTNCSIDFSSAFLQADLPSPIWVHLPRGFTSNKPGKTCLCLKKSQYGLTVAPRLWYQHLITALKDMGLKQSKQDACLLYKKNLLIIVYVDDVGVAAPSSDLIDQFVADLKNRGFELTREGSFSEFLGIKFEEDTEAGAITLTQKGLIKKVLLQLVLNTVTQTTLQLLHLPLELIPMASRIKNHGIIHLLLVCFFILQLTHVPTSPSRSAKLLDSIITQSNPMLVQSR